MCRSARTVSACSLQVDHQAENCVGNIGGIVMHQHSATAWQSPALWPCLRQRATSEASSWTGTLLQQYGSPQPCGHESVRGQYWQHCCAPAVLKQHGSPSPAAMSLSKVHQTSRCSCSQFLYNGSDTNCASCVVKKHQHEHPAHMTIQVEDVQS